MPVGQVTADTVEPDENRTIPLTLDRVLESSGDAAGGDRITLYGGGFLTGATVSFGTTAGDNPLVLDGERINVTTPPHGPGLVHVTVELLDGRSATLREAYLFRGPLALTAISPDQGPVAGGSAVTVVGAGFDADTRVIIGDRQLESLELVDAETITGVVPARLVGRPGPVDVVVSDGFEQRVLTDAYRYIDPIRVDWLHPPSGTVRGGTEVTLYGAGLARDTTVQVDGVHAEIVVPGHGQGLTFRTPPAGLGVAGPVDLLIAHAEGSLVLARGFSYLPDDEPVGVELVAAWPVSGPVSGGTQVALTVRGLAPTGAIAVRVGDEVVAPLEVRTSDNLVVIATPAHPAGAAAIAVSQTGRGEDLREDLFTFASDLTLRGITPAFGATGGGQQVTVEGVGLSADVTVLIGGRPAPITDSGAASVVVRVPPGSPGSVDVVVVAPDGRRATLPAGFEYRAGGGAKVLAVTPPRGAQAGGRIVRVHGQGFRSGSPVVTFGGVRARSQEVVDDGLVIARPAAAEPGEVNVRLSPGGQMAMAYRFFDPAQRFGGTAGGRIPEAINVSVLDIVTGEGVENAFVILWDDLDTPYQGVTDDRGQLTFSDVGFGPLQMVTASGDSYTTASIVDVDARDVTLHLIPLTPSPPGGGPGPGPRPLEDSRLTGEVSGLDKYVVPPPGNCDNHLAIDPPEPGTLCQPCEVDSTCDGNGSRCVDLGEQGRRCTISCRVDADCPEGFGCAGVAFGATQCVPAPGRRAARCSVTQPDIFADPSGPDDIAVTDEEGVYALDSRPGEYAVVCLGGYIDELDAFIPTMMGVRRHVFALPGDLVGQQDVRLDIPLDRDLRIRLDDAPLGQRKTELHTVDVFVDLGADGVFHMPSSGSELNRNVFDLPNFPVRFAESLYDASYTFYATATANAPPEEQTGEGSFNVVYDVTAVDDDSVFDVVDDGVQVHRVGVTHDVHAMDGLGDRVWAAADDGRVLVFDGALWATQQTPAEATLRDVWPASPRDVWAVGDAGAVIRFGGLIWEPVPVMPGLEDIDWRGVEGVGDAVWLWGEAGVFAHDGVSMGQVILDVGADAVLDVWGDDTGGAWVVGGGGLIRFVPVDGQPQLHDLAGEDLHAVWGTSADDVWAVGARGRIAHYNGAVWFDYLPLTRQTLRSVHATSPESVWAVGDGGVVLHFDGIHWREHGEAPHNDLRGVWRTDSGRTVAAGVHTVVLGPWLRLALPGNPTAEGVLDGLTLRWFLDPGPTASLTWVELQTETGLPFWTLISEGARETIPLPDLDAAWGLQAIWPGNGFMQVVRAELPDFDINAYDNSVLTPYAWRSWSVAGWPLVIPSPDTPDLP